MKTVIIIIIVVFILSVATNIIYNRIHPCIQEKTYCYYETHGLSTGVGPSTSGNGGMAVVVSPTTSKVYIDCENTDSTPETIRYENKCILRK